MTTTRTRTLTALSIATVLALLVALPFGLFIWVAVLASVLGMAGLALHFRDVAERLQVEITWAPGAIEENEQLKADNMRLAAELEDAQGRLHDAETVLVPLVSFANPSTRPNVTSISGARLAVVPKQREGDHG